MLRSPLYRLAILATTIFALPSLKAEEADRPTLEMAILPGQWRPEFPFEQIAWVRSPWSKEMHPDYVILDFPEAIFVGQDLLYLGHTNPRFPSLYADLPAVPWRWEDDKMFFDRTLPNGVQFGGSLALNGPSIVSLELFIKNGSPQPLNDIKLQTCALLKHTTHFSKNTAENKMVHMPDGEWVDFDKASVVKEPQGQFLVGWRSGPAAADLPVMATVSDLPNQLIAMTWYDATLSMTSNPWHPCMHADPVFPNLAPGEQATIHGELIFFEGTLEEFGEWFKKRWESKKK